MKTSKTSSVGVAAFPTNTRTHLKADTRTRLNASRRRRRARARLVAALLLLAAFAAAYLAASPGPTARAASSTVVISQVYGGGGNSGAPYKNDFIELFNRGNTIVNLSSWSVQYASATGSSWQVTPLSGSIAPGKYYLVQEDAGTGCSSLPCGQSLPTADVIGTINMSATAGKVALVNTTAALSGSCPLGPSVVDFVGYGSSANCSEGSGPAPSPAVNNSTAVIRNGQGAQDTDNNARDFTAGAPNPRNSSSAATTTISFGASSKACAFSPTGLPLDPAAGLNWNHTMSGGASRVLVVGVSTFAQSGLPLVGALPVNRVAAVTYNGVPLNRINATAAASPGASPTSAVEMFRLTDSDPGGLPAAGASAAVVVRLSAPVNYAVGGAASFSGVNQTTPTATFVSASGGDNNPRATVASATNEVVIDSAATVFDITGGAALTADAGQSERWNGKDDNCFPDAGGLVSIGAGSTRAGAASVQTSWTMPGAHDWALGAVPLKPLSLTAVELAEFEAVRTGAGVTLRWRTGFEVDNLGFNVYRERKGVRTRLNASLLAGSALFAGEGTALTAGRTYQFKDTAGDADSLYWLEDVSLDGEATMHGPAAHGAAGLLPQAGGMNDAVPLKSFAPVRAGATSSPSSSRPAQNEWPAVSARGLATARDPSPSRAGADARRTQQQWDLASAPAVKIGVREEGWCRVSRAELVAAGLSEAANPRFLQLYADGREVPLIVNGNGKRLAPEDYLEFYGVGLDTPSADTRLYWLVAGSRAGLRVETDPCPKPTPAPKSPARVASPAATPAFKTPTPGFDLTVERRERLTYFPALLNGDAENFFGPPLTSSPTAELLSVHHLSPSDARSAVLEVAAQGLTGAAHQVKVSLGGVDVGSFSFKAREHAVGRFPVPPALLKDGDNTLNLISVAGPSDVSLLDYVRLTYTHTFQADEDALRFSASPEQTLRVAGFTSRDVRVLDITDPDSPREVEVVAEADGAGFAVNVPAARKPSDGPRLLFAFTTRRVAHPAFVKANRPSDLNRGARHGADLLIVTHEAFRASAERLAAARRLEGLRVEVVDVEDIYDEWSCGAHGAQALDDFFAHAKAYWSRAPRFILLLGDASFDPRDYLGLGAFDLVPSKTVDTATLETASDDALADFDGDRLADVCVGRLPVRTSAEAEAVVSKIISYRPTGLPSLLLVNDRKGGDGYDFDTAARGLLASAPAATSVQSITRGDDAALNRLQIINALNAGPSVVNFHGHGAEDLWTSADLLPAEDAKALNNAGGLSLFVLMTCLNGYHQNAYRDSLAETLLKAERGGAVAVWASSGITAPTAQAAMNEEFFRQLYGRGPLPLGEIVRRAKAATVDADVRATWTLFGDPTTMLR